MRIAHFQVAAPGAGAKVTRLARMIEQLRGVAGVIVVRSLGLLTVLYDEGRTDPVTISDTLVRWRVGAPERPAAAVAGTTWSR